MKHIGIVGAGIAGLHLGLFLCDHGIAATIYTEKTPRQLGERLSNIVIRFAPTRERERRLGVNYWDQVAPDIGNFSIYVGGDRPLQFTGELEQPGSIVDMRIYCARLLQEFAMRGGQVAGHARRGQLSFEWFDLLATWLEVGRAAPTPPAKGWPPFGNPLKD